MILKSRQTKNKYSLYGGNKDEINKENFLVGGKTVYGTDLENATILLHKL